MSYVDISILNPDNEVLGYQFTIGNEIVMITNVENLVSDYPIQPAFSSYDNMVLGISLEDSLIQKNYDPVPLCRIYYALPLGFNIGQNFICIEEIIDVVNQDYENVISINNTEPCDEINPYDIEELDGVNSLIIYPNPATESFFISLSLQEKQESVVSVFDVIGNLISTHKYFEKDLYTEIDVSSLSKGIYNVKIDYDKGMINKKIVIQK